MSDSIRQEASKLNILHIKLNSGNEIITSINLSGENYYIIESPFTLVKKFEEDGAFYFDFEEYFPMNECDLSTLYTSSIESLCQVDESMKENYLNAIVTLAGNNMETNLIDPYLNISSTIH